MADKVIRYRGEFDASNILASLKNIRSEMQKNGADSVLFGNVDKDIQKAESLMRDLQAQIKTGFRNQKDIDNFEKKFQTLNQTLSKVNVGLGDIAKPENFKQQSKELTNLKTQLQSIIDSQSDLKEAANSAVEKFSTKAMRKELSQAIEKGENLQAVLAKVAAQQFSSGQGTLNKQLAGTTDTQRATAAGKVGEGLFDNSEKLNLYRQALLNIAIAGESVESAFSELKGKLDEEETEWAESSAFVEQYTSDLKELVNELGNYDTVNKGLANAAVNKMTSAGGVDISGNYQTGGNGADIEAYANALSTIEPLQQEIASREKAMASAAAQHAQTVTDGLNDAAMAQQQVVAETDKATEATREQAQAQEATNQVFDNIKNAITRYTSLSTIIATVWSQIKQTTATITELDKAFGQIAMVTEFSIEDMWSKYQSYADLANKLGQSTLSVVQASGLYFQQGLEEAEALQLTESTMKLATLAGLDFQQATSLMTSAVRGFHMEMSEGEHVTDVYSELAAHAAASVEGIANAMSRTAAIASSAGMEFETTAAMLTTMIEATQESPETLGTAMKTVIARFTELKDNVSALDSEFDDLDYNKVDKALKSIGVSLKDTNGQFRDIDDVFLEVSERWDTLDRNTQRYIATTAAGSRQQSRFIALMENYERTQELITTAQNSAGRSSEQFAKYQDTLENKVNRLKNSWEQLRLQFLKSDFLKNVIDMVNNLVTSMNKMEPKKLVALGIVVASVGKTIVLDIVKGFQNNQEKLTKAFTTAFETAWDKTQKELQKKQQQTSLIATEEKINNTKQQKDIISSQLEVRKKDLDKISNKLNDQKEIIESQENEIKNQNELLKYQEEIEDENVNKTRKQIITENEKLEDFRKEKQELEEQKRFLEGAVDALEQAEEKHDEIISDLEKEKQLLNEQPQPDAPSNKGEGESDFKSSAKSMIASGVADSVKAGVVTGVTAGFASGDVKTGIEGGLAAAGAAFIPTLSNLATLGLEAILPKIATALGHALGPILAAAAVAAAIYAAAKLKEMGDKLIDPVNMAQDQLDKDQEKLSRKSEMAVSAGEWAQETKTTAQNLEELITRYNELKGMQVKTTEQQEEYNGLIEQIKTEYPDWIEYENSRTGELTLQTEQMERQLEIAQQQAHDARVNEMSAVHEANTAEYSVNNSQIDLNAAQEKKEAQTAKTSQINTINEKYAEYIQLTDEGEILSANGKMYTNEELKKILGDDLDTIEHIYSDYNDKIKEIEDDAANKRQENFDEYIEKQKEVYNDYAKDGLEGADDALADALADQALKNAQNSTESSNRLRKLFYKKDEEGIKELSDDFKTDEKARNKIINSQYGEYLAGLFGVSTDDADWRATLDEKLQSTTMTAADIIEHYTQYLTDKVRADQIDLLEEEIKKDPELMEAYTDFLSRLGSLTPEELSNVEVTDNDAINSAMQANIDAQRKEIRDLVSDDSWLFKAAGGEERTVTVGYAQGVVQDITNIKLSTEELEQLKNTKQQIIDQLYPTGEDIDPDKVNEVMDTYLQTLSDAGVREGDQARVAALFDFSDVDINNLQEYTDGWEAQLQEWGYSAQKASNIVQNAITFGEGQNLTSGFFTTEAQVETYQEGIVEKFEAIQSAGEDLSTWAAQAQGNDGLVPIEASDTKKIDELAAAIGKTGEEFYEWDEASQSYVLNAKALQRETDNFLNKQMEVINQSIKEIENKDELSDSDKVLLNSLKELRDETQLNINKTKEQIDVEKQLQAIYDQTVSDLNSLISSYKSLATEMNENGEISYDTFSSFASSMEGINTQLQNLGIKTKDFSDFIYEENGAVKANTKSFKKWIEEMIIAIEAQGGNAELAKKLRFELSLLNKELEDTTEEIEKANQEAWDTYNSDVQSKYEEWQEALDKIKEKEEAVAEAEEKVKEAEEELLKTEEKLQEIYYGEANHKNKLDYLYNYTTELEQLEKKAKDAAEALDNLSPDDDVHQKVEDYKNALADEVANYKAQNEVIKQYLANQKQMLDEGLSQRLEQLKAEGAVDTSTNVSDFYYERDGRWYVDYQKLNAAKLPDDVSDFIEEQVDNMNKYAKAYEDNLDKIEAARKEFEQRQKAARDKYIEVENKVVELLKKKDQEELDSLKNKYDGMKEADDEYTSALEESIKKQRDLRNQANQWDDLAEKEKKLSLQQRDTSGANAKEIQKTQDDITKTRESLLDNAVDNIVNNLKELYAEQEETRQAEIEYRQAILDNKNYVDEATAIINNWENAQNALDFFMEMDEQFNEASDATFSKLVDDVNGYYEDSVYYYEMAGQDFEDIINQANEEANSKIRDTSETLTSESERALDETMDKVHEAQEKGREDVEAAKKAVEDAKQAVVDATKAVAEALEEARKKQEEYNAAIAAQPAGGGGGNNGKGGSNDTDNDEEEKRKREYQEQQEKEIEERRNRILSQLEGLKKKENNFAIMAISTLMSDGAFNDSNEVVNFLKTHDYHGAIHDSSILIAGAESVASKEAAKKWGGGYSVFKSGGLVDYTGPAWVDGTPSSPEAFLSADDTRRIDILTNILSSLPAFDLNSLSKLSTLSNTIGDATFNIDINVESISSDYDVDQMVERVHEDILSITNRPGTMVTLSR